MLAHHNVHTRTDRLTNAAPFSIMSVVRLSLVGCNKYTMGRCIAKWFCLKYTINLVLFYIIMIIWDNTSFEHYSEWLVYYTANAHIHLHEVFMLFIMDLDICIHDIFTL